MIDSEIWVLVLMCVIGVVTFFVLWAILAYVIKRISERGNEKRDRKSDETTNNNEF